MYKYKLNLINSSGRAINTPLISWYTTSTEWRVGTVLANTWEVVGVSVWQSSDNTWINIY